MRNRITNGRDMYHMEMFYISLGMRLNYTFNVVLVYAVIEIIVA